MGAVFMTNWIVAKWLENFILAFICIKNNLRVFVEFVRSKDNILADSLSRLDYKRFWKFARKDMNILADPIPDWIYPVNKVWENTFHKLMF